MGLCGGPATGVSVEDVGGVGVGWKLVGIGEAEGRRGSLEPAGERAPPVLDSALTFCKDNTEERRYTLRGDIRNSTAIGLTLISMGDYSADVAHYMVQCSVFLRKACWDFPVSHLAMQILVQLLFQNCCLRYFAVASL